MSNNRPRSISITSRNDNGQGPFTGYAHQVYAESLSEFGSPWQLPHSGGWLLKRQIPGTNDHDAMGCYPLFACPDWGRLNKDFDNLEQGVVAISLVTDPFGNYSEPYLRKCFPDLVTPFKKHYVADLTGPISSIPSKHHRYYAQRALTKVSVERCPDPQKFLTDWIKLYDFLVARHKLTGIKAFSHQAFAAQLRVPGIVMLRAVLEGKTVGAHLWFVQGEVAHSHLAAVNAVGYEVMASYALYQFALESFAREVRWLNLGAAAGLSEAQDGLTRFKRGWATDTRIAYLCGRIVNRVLYERLLIQKGARTSDYFPAYREGEFS
jgi:hypothetical protein